MTSGFDVTICLLGICVCFLVLVFVSFFFVRFRSRLVRCRFALDLMDAAVAWLGTDIRGSSGVPQEVFYFSVLQVHPNQRKKSGTMAGGNKTKAKKHIFPAPSYSTTPKGRTKASRRAAKAAVEPKTPSQSSKPSQKRSRSKSPALGRLKLMCLTSASGCLCRLLSRRSTAT